MSITGFLADPSRLARLTLVVEPPPLPGLGAAPLRLPLPDGDAGVMNTLAAMSALARDAAALPIVRAFAMADRERRAPDADQLWHTLARAVKFKRDPDRLELLRHPAGLIRDMAVSRRAALGDCDDRAVLGASIALARGWPCSLRVIGQRADGPYQHVYLVLDGVPGRGSVAIDPQETNKVGAEAAHERAHTVRIEPQ